MPPVVREASITASPLSVDRLLDLVRDHDHDAAVTSLDYSVHPTAEQVLVRCAEQVAAGHDLLSLAVSHRSGHLEVGDLAVVVAAGAVHRRAALEACRALIDTVKAEVPIWKEQALAGGGTEWVGLPGDDEGGAG